MEQFLNGNRCEPRERGRAFPQLPFCYISQGDLDDAAELKIYVYGSNMAMFNEHLTSVSTGNHFKTAETKQRPPPPPANTHTLVYVQKIKAQPDAFRLLYWWAAGEQFVLHRITADTKRHESRPDRADLFYVPLVWRCHGM